MNMYNKYTKEFKKSCRMYKKYIGKKKFKNLSKVRITITCNTEPDSLVCMHHVLYIHLSVT